MKFNRNYITPFIALVFLVMAISGLLMFFHLSDGYTEVAHEYFGLGFVIIAAVHITVNWKPLSSHFKKNVFLPTGIVVVVISITSIIVEKMHPPIDLILIERIVKAPIADAFRALEIDFTEAFCALEKKGISVGKAKTIEEIWVNNDVSPEEVINAIIK